MRPIGVPDEHWSVGYSTTFAVDGLPLVGSWGGGNYTARATARVGRLMLREGDWEGRRLISAEAVRSVTRDAGTPGNCGIGWWNNNEGGFPELPQDAFWGSGAGHQVVFVVPSLNLIAVRNGNTLGTGNRAPRGAKGLPVPAAGGGRHGSCIASEMTSFTHLYPDTRKEPMNWSCDDAIDVMPIV